MDIVEQIAAYQQRMAAARSNLLNGVSNVAILEARLLELRQLGAGGGRDQAASNQPATKLGGESAGGGGHSGEESEAPARRAGDTD